MTKARTLADNFAADINGITAGTGITGGGTSGTVTITNQMATTIDAKGDLVVGTGADAFGRLAVASTAGYVLTVDSAETTGLKWAAAASSSGPAFEARRNGNQTVTASTQTKIEFNQEDYDTGNCFDSTTNYRFTPNKAGYYQINLTVVGENSAGTLRVIGSIYKNGSVYSRLIDNTPNSTITQQTGSSLIYFNGTTDYVEGYVSIGGTSGTMVPDNGTGFEAVFSGVWIRS